jgi:hypothetical protein
MNVVGKPNADGLVYIKCPKADCAAGLRIKPKSAHTTVTCANCGNKFVLDVAEAGASGSPPPIPKQAGKNRDTDEPKREPGRPKHPWEVDDEDRRRERREERRRQREEEKSFPAGLVVGIAGGALILIAIAVVAVIYFTRDDSPSKPSTPVASGPVAEKTGPGSVGTGATTTSPSPSIATGSSTIPPAKSTDLAKVDPPKSTNGGPDNVTPSKGKTPPKKKGPTKPPTKTPDSPVRDAIEVVKKSTALIEGKGGWGTGFVIRPGIVMTNAHVINGFLLNDLSVSFVSLDDTAPPKLKPTLLFSDSRRDLAILRVDTDRPPLEMTEPGTDLAGMSVAVVGNPADRAKQAQINKVTTGKLSNPIRRDAGWTYYELNAEAYFGNSGGPVVNEKTGKLVGVMQSILGDGKQKSYCIPYGEALLALSTLPESKSDEPKATRIASGRHYLEYVADHMGEMELNAEDAMSGQLVRLQAKSVGARVEVTVRTTGGRTTTMSLTEFMELLRSKHATVYPTFSKTAMPAVEASSEIPSELKRLTRQRIEAYMNMYGLANQATNTEKAFREAMDARKAASVKAARAFKDAYDKFLDEMERRPPTKAK